MHINFVSFIPNDDIGKRDTFTYMSDFWNDSLILNILINILTHLPTK